MIDIKHGFQFLCILNNSFFPTRYVFFPYQYQFNSYDTRVKKKFIFYK